MEDNTQMPELEESFPVPDKQTIDYRTDGRLRRQPTLTKRNVEALKQANREIALAKIDIEQYVEKQVSLAFSDDTDERTTAQERVAARKWVESVAFSTDSGVKTDSGQITINITGIGSDNLKDVVSVEDEDGDD